MEEHEQLRVQILNLCKAQNLAVLSTQREGQPYASLIAFAVVDDLTTILFATSRTTRKYANLKACPQVALLIDNRSNQDTDFHRAMAVTVVGGVLEAVSGERHDLQEILLAKHPYLENFVKAESTALLRVMVDRYYLVSNFEDVMELHIRR